MMQVFTFIVVYAVTCSVAIVMPLITQLSMHAVSRFVVCAVVHEAVQTFNGRVVDAVCSRLCNSY